jgi:hypothetical protein
MMSIMCVELSAPAHIGAVLERRLDELLQRAAALILANCGFYRTTPGVPPSRRLAEHFAVHTPRSSDAD